MRNKYFIILSALVVSFAVSCEKINTISGEQSSLGEVGAVIKCRFEGVSDADIRVTGLENGISTIEGSFTLSDPRYMRVLKNYPMYFDINGDKVRLHNFKAKFTDKGIQKCADGDNSIIIKYDSNEGDRYSSNRKVTHKSTDNDFLWWGFMNIKVIEVECDAKNIDGAKKITYWGNHKFGIVAIETVFEDGSSDRASIRINGPQED